MKNKLLILFLFLIIALFSKENFANSDDNSLQLRKLNQQLQDLQIKVKHLEQNTDKPKATSSKNVGNLFNPEIALILNGKYNISSDSAGENKISGFPLGEEAAKKDNRGFSLGETELNLGSKVDDLFSGLVTLAFNNNQIEVEQAFIETLKLPFNLNLKVGRFLSDIGYLNSHHVHTDNFINRPLPYQAFLNDFFNDDGMQISWLTPAPFYLEIGLGAYAGNKFPSGGNSNNNGAGAYSGFIKTGGQIFENGIFSTGLSYLRTTSDRDGRETSTDNQNLFFQGRDNLYIADFKYDWSPNGNNFPKELIFQTEYFLRKENGLYVNKDENYNVIGEADYDGKDSGWYAEIIYKFIPKWRLGYRYSKMYPASLSKVNPALENSAVYSGGFRSTEQNYMIDFTNSEFSRIRFQYSNKKLVAGEDNQSYSLQYIISIGSHPAHKF